MVLVLVIGRQDYVTLGVYGGDSGGGFCIAMEMVMTLVAIRVVVTVVKY